MSLGAIELKRAQRVSPVLSLSVQLSRTHDDSE